MNILAIDCGTKTGWASWSNGHLESGVHEFNIGRGESPGLRFLRFRSWLVDMLTMTEPDLVVYEQAHLRGGHAVDLLVGMTSRIQEECAGRRIEYGACHSATLKKFATGSGRAEKAAMKEFAARTWGKQPQDDNEGDALCLLAWAKQTLGGGRP
jgi:Holliday junction resolvasome RuvABC endonuclease subunit